MRTCASRRRSSEEWQSKSHLFARARVCGGVRENASGLVFSCVRVRACTVFAGPTILRGNCRGCHIAPSCCWDSGRDGRPHDLVRVQGSNANLWGVFRRGKGGCMGHSHKIGVSSNADLFISRFLNICTCMYERVFPCVCVFVWVFECVLLTCSSSAGDLTRRTLCCRS